MSQGYLPKERAEFCEDEYFQIKDAFEILLHPHLDLDLAKKNLDGAWVCVGDGNQASGEWQNCVSVADSYTNEMAFSASCTPCLVIGRPINCVPFLDGLDHPDVLD